MRGDSWADLDWITRDYSSLESGGLPPERFPLDHARVTVVSIEKRLTHARALLAASEPEKGEG